MFIAISYVNWVFDKYLNKEPDEQNEISAKMGLKRLLVMLFAGSSL